MTTRARLLHLIAAVAAATGATLLSLRSQHYFGSDFDVYRVGAQAASHLFSDKPGLYTEVGIHHLPFTYPPFAALAFIPFAFISQPLALAIFTALSIPVAVGAAWLVVKVLIPDFNLVASHPAAALFLLSFTIPLCGPWRDTLTFGQVNIVLFGLILLDLLLPPRIWRYKGVLTGIAAGIKLTPLAFVLYFVCAKDVRGTLRMLGGFAGTIVVGLIFRPLDSATYWLHLIFDSNRVGGGAYIDNISLRGTLMHVLGKQSPGWLWVILCLACVALAGYACFYALRDSGFTVLQRNVMGISAVALAMLLVSPVSWSHHFVWVVVIIPAVAVALSVRRRLPERGRPLWWKPTNLLAHGTLVLGMLAFYLAPKIIDRALGQDIADVRPSLAQAGASIGTLAALLLLVCLAWAVRQPAFHDQSFTFMRIL